VATVLYGNFEWDSAKAESNETKHGVTFEEAAKALADVNEVSTPDKTYPDRSLSLVMSPYARVLLVVTTEVTDRTRIISARKATKHEQRAYARG
jgi:uncharacterized protein